MGLRDKVALIFVTILIIQITLIFCMPRSSRKEALKQYLGSFNQYKTSPTSASGLKKNIRPSIFTKSIDAKISGNIPPNKSMYNTYGFPEIEYPFDTSPRDPFYCDINSNPFEGLNKAVVTTQPQIIDDLKKEMRLKRKLNRVSDQESQIKKEMPSLAKYSSGFEQLWFNGQETFPQVEYPMTAMEIWEPRYWKTFNYQNGQQNNLDLPTFDPKVCEKSTIFYKPKQQSKSKTKQYIEEINRLKEKMRRASSTQTLKTTAQDAIKVFSSDTDFKNVSKSNSTTTSVSCVINETEIEYKDEKCLVNANISEETKPDDPRLPSNTISYTPKIADKELVISEIESDKIFMTPIPILYINLDVCPVIKNNHTENVTKSIVQSTEEPSVQDEINSDTFEKVVTKGDNSLFQTIELAPKVPLDEISLKDIEDLLANITDGINVCLESNNLTHAPEDDDFKLSTLDPLNIKIPIPQEYVLEYTAPLDEPANTNDQPHVDKIPYTSVIVVPVGDSIKEIQLPIIETNTGAPIIIFVPATHTSEKPATSIDNLKDSPSDTVAPSNLSYNDMSYNCTSENHTQNDMPSNVQKVEYNTKIPSKRTNGTENLNKQTILSECENLPINSMCHGTEDTSITSTSETYQHVSTFDEPFLEMLQPIIAIVDTSSNNLPNIADMLPSISDSGEVSYNPKENFSLNEVSDTVILPLSINEDYSNTPGISKDLTSRDHEIPISTWMIKNNLNKTDNSILLNTPCDPSELPNETDPAILNINYSQEDNIVNDGFPMPIDIVLPMDVVINMIKNGTLLPLHNYLETPVINIETRPMGPVVGLFSNNVPANKLVEDKFERSDNDEVVDLTKGTHSAPQAMELQDILSFTSPLESLLPIEDFVTNSQSSEGAQNILPLLEKVVPNDHSSILLNVNKDPSVWTPEETEQQPTFKYFNNTEKSISLPDEDTKSKELPIILHNVPSKDLPMSDKVIENDNIILMLDEAVTDSPSIDTIEEYVPLQMSNIEDVSTSYGDKYNKGNSSPYILNSEQEDDDNGKQLKSFDSDYVQNFKELHTSPFSNSMLTENIKENGLNKEPPVTEMDYLTEEELLPATRDVKNLL